MTGQGSRATEPAPATGLARQARDWAAADSLRQHTAELGFEVQDTSEGSRWHYVGASKAKWLHEIPSRIRKAASPRHTPCQRGSAPMQSPVGNSLVGA